MFQYSTTIAGGRFGHTIEVDGETRISSTVRASMVRTETPPVREAACKDLRMFSRSAPFDTADSAKLLAADPDFIKAAAACAPEKDVP